MYSGETDEEEKIEEEESHPQTTTSTVIDPIGDEFLTKLNALKFDCIQFHKILETALQTSGICRRYKISSTQSSRSYRKTLTEIQNPQIIYKNPIRKIPSPRKSTTKKLNNVRIHQNTNNNYSNTNFIEKSKQELKKYFQKRKELNEKPHLIPLRPKMVKAGLTRKNGTGYVKNGTKKNKLRKRNQTKKVIWLPRKTIPEPFMFTLREESQPTKAHYSMNFLQKLLEEKEEQEAKEQDRRNRQFRARPPPETTYVSDSNFYVGRQPLIPKLNRLSSRSASEPAISPRKPLFRAHPIPPSTYIRPSSMTDELRAQAKSQRTVELLLQSREPFGMKDHEIRSHVQYRIRHYPSCYSSKPTFQPNITKSVPDFRVLQMEFENHLSNARKSRPSTVVEPFHFHDSQFSKHFCDNMKSYQKLLKLKTTATKKEKSSPAKTSSSRLSRNTSATFIV
uniref:Uncharacterized protein n=1 Tax=Panagrolaimus sp. PS1159 TaxID=55785 RepID=A0AC35F562_9BILA